MFRGAKKRTFRFGKKNVSFPKVETFRFADYRSTQGANENDSESFLESNLFHVVSNFCYKRTAWSLDSQSF